MVRVDEKGVLSQIVNVFSEMGSIKDRSGSGRFVERIRAEISPGCSAPLQQFSCNSATAATCNSQKREDLLCSVNCSAVQYIKPLIDGILIPKHELFDWHFALIKIFLPKVIEIQF